MTFTRRFSASLIESLIIQRVRFHRIADKFLSSGAPFLRARREYGFWKKLRELRSLVDATTTLVVDLAYLNGRPDRLQINRTCYLKTTNGFFVTENSTDTRISISI